MSGTQDSTKISDAFEQQLQQEFQKLKQCQQSKNLGSCLQCQEIIGCKIRKAYVSAVYKSMSKGQGGDFEF